MALWRSFGLPVVLGHVWRDVQRTQLGQVIDGVIGHVLADGDATAAFSGLGLEHVFRRAPLGRSCSMRDPTVRRQTIPVLHCDVSHVAEPGLLPLRLPIEPAVGIGHAGMSIVLALLAVEVRAIVPSLEPSFGRKLLCEAQASISVPSTEKARQRSAASPRDGSEASP
jgi:hypothetical protein